MKKHTERTTTIDSGHAKGANQTHDRDQLRRRLLKMILQNEAQRRSLEPAGRLKAGSNKPPATLSNLAVFDPEDFIGKELAASSNDGQKPA